MGAVARYSEEVFLVVVVVFFYSVHLFLFKLGYSCVSITLLSKEQFHVHKENYILSLKWRIQFSIIRTSWGLVFTKHI